LTPSQANGLLHEEFVKAGGPFMRQTLAPILISMIYCSLGFGAEKNISINLDIWLVSDLIQDLSKDDFADRELATQRLIALGTAVLPEINEVSDGARLDAETRERLNRVARDAQYAHLTTVSAAASEYERLIDAIAVMDPRSQMPAIEIARGRADRVLERIEALVSPDQRNRILAELLSATGARLFRSRYCEKQTLALRFAINDLQLSLYCYGQVLERQPREPQAEEGQRRTATLLGSARWLESSNFE